MFEEQSRQRNQDKIEHLNNEKIYKKVTFGLGFRLARLYFY